MNPDDGSICCPRFEPSQWDGKIFDWQQKKFVVKNVWSFYYVPLNLGPVMKHADVELRHAGVELQDAMALSRHTSPWRMEQYLAVNAEVPGLRNTSLSGRFKCKVYEGKFEDTAKWMKDFEADNAVQGLQVADWWMWYTTCPKCAKKYGKNYVAIFCQLK